MPMDPKIININQSEDSSEEEAQRFAILLSTFALTIKLSAIPAVLLPLAWWFIKKKPGKNLLKLGIPSMLNHTSLAGA